MTFGGRSKLSSTTDSPHCLSGLISLVCWLTELFLQSRTRKESTWRNAGQRSASDPAKQYSPICNRFTRHSAIVVKKC